MTETKERGHETKGEGDDDGLMCFFQAKAPRSWGHDRDACEGSSSNRTTHDNNSREKKLHLLLWKFVKGLHLVNIRNELQQAVADAWCSFSKQMPRVLEELIETRPNILQAIGTLRGQQPHSRSCFCFIKYLAKVERAAAGLDVGLVNQPDVIYSDLVFQCQFVNCQIHAKLSLKATLI